MEGLELLESLVGHQIVKVIEYERDDYFYLMMEDGRLIRIWAFPTNVSTAIPVIEEISEADARHLPKKSVREPLGIS